MQPYRFSAIEQKWQARWAQQKQESPILASSPTYYILNMFPYPSGSGLHVGHYTGYIASDILARYHKHQGYHVINPMGFDAFGLPAEQYAIQTGQHPAITTEQNIQKYIAQLKQIGVDFDWDRTIYTSDPEYYKWTQWIFLELFHSWYNKTTQKAAPIGKLIAEFVRNGNHQVSAACDPDTPRFSAKAWHAFSTTEQEKMLLHYRLAYLKDSVVNWCPGLGSVLANEEVKEGFSERGGYPVMRKKMQQWSLRMTAYAERLLKGLDGLDWPLSTKEMQRHWIGRSEGAEIAFRLAEHPGEALVVFTTRPEMIFGACFIALAPEHPFAEAAAQQSGEAELIAYIEQAKNCTERSRLAASTALTALSLGRDVLHPFTGARLPILITDALLPHSGTAAVMGVPAHDKRDHAFAQSFHLPSLPVIASNGLLEDSLYEAREGKMIHSDFLNGLSVPEAFEAITQKLVQDQIGHYAVRYKLQDPVFSRQRYWGEPLPLYYKDDGLPYALPEDQLPLRLPQVSSYQPKPSGEPPLSNAPNWTTPEGYPLESTTMPGWAGSSWYFLRYMDPHNAQALVDKEKEAYWKGVDCYIGGAEHATSHLLYARFWTKFLHDLGHIYMDEPFAKLFHQGMMQGCSALVYRIKNSDIFVSYGLIASYDVAAMHVPIAFVKNDILDLEAFKHWRPDLANATFVLEEGRYLCGRKMEKMSKSKHNVVNPDAVIAEHGADALRLYIMFLGPLEQGKIWNISGIEGINRFLYKVWRLVHQAQPSWPVATVPEQMEKLMHKTIKRVTDSIVHYSFNTAISSLMICVNALADFKTISQSIVERLLLLLEPFAPYMAAELWEYIGHKDAINQIPFPTWETRSLAEHHMHYPIAVNGKVRTKMLFAQDTPHTVIEQAVLTDSVVQKWLSGHALLKVIIVPNRMVNVVVAKV